jgi:import inner membrane translocase subunit TIM50
MYFMGKAFKYTTWAASAAFFYHWVCIKNYENVNDAWLINQHFLEYARKADWFIFDMKTLLTKPGMTKMLPDVLEFPGAPNPKTLVLNFNGTIVHQSYKLGVGVELFKRPGLSTFLNRMAKYYEIVIFGMGESHTIMEAQQALDPQQQMIVGAFGRENTVLKDGEYIKDLSYLNRPLKNVVYVDFEDSTVKYHKDNCIILPKFEGDLDDRSLLDVIPFLERKLPSFLT